MVGRVLSQALRELEQCEDKRVIIARRCAIDDSCQLQMKLDDNTTYFVRQRRERHPRRSVDQIQSGQPHLCRRLAHRTHLSSATAKYGAEPSSIVSSAAQARKRTETDGSFCTRLSSDGRISVYGESERKTCQCLYSCFGSICERRLSADRVLVKKNYAQLPKISGRSEHRS